MLADGLAYAAADLEPDVMVDLATLTGAVSVALGRRTAGLFATDDGLAAALSAAGERGGERVWRLPLVEEYRPAIDLTGGGPGQHRPLSRRSGGSITAALFLREFVGGVPWAHFDIAGTARSGSDDGEISRGGTGWGPHPGQLAGSRRPDGGTGAGAGLSRAPTPPPDAPPALPVSRAFSRRSGRRRCSGRTRRARSRTQNGPGQMNWLYRVSLSTNRSARRWSSCRRWCRRRDQ